MFNTETTPLVKPSDRKQKSATIWCICLAISVVALIILFYHGNASSVSQNVSRVELSADINAPALVQTRYPKYPSESTLKAYRSMTRIIEYKPDELPQGTITDIFDSANSRMRGFHSHLIEKNGYDHTTHNIIFAVSNPPDDTSTEKLSCKYLYSYASSEDSGRFMELNCPSDHVITGCTALSKYSDGIRWGELAYETSECFTHAVTSSKTDFFGTLLTASCCKVDNSNAQLHTTYSTSVTSNSDFCVETECPNNMVAFGCTATDSHQATNKFSGTKWLRNSHFLSGCKAQRSDLGYLWQAAYCAQLKNSRGNLICISESGSEPMLTESGDYQSEAVCNSKGYVMTDCNGYINHQIDHCTAGKAYKNDLGLLYGSYMFHGESESQSTNCFAVGNTNAVRAEAICCKIK